MQRLGFPDPLAAHVVPGPIPDDLKQPARESLGLPAFVDSLDGHDERLLTHVFRILHGTGHGERDGMARTQIPLEEAPGSVAVAAPDSKDQLGIRLFHVHQMTRWEVKVLRADGVGSRV